MRFWWVIQNQTFRHEFSCGYLWSPKRSANLARTRSLKPFSTPPRAT